MSTNADIILQTTDGYESIYLHFDGYPSHTFEMLKQHYASREKVENMMALGNLCVLAPSLDCPVGHSFETPVKDFCIFYGRDRDEIEQDALKSHILKSHIEKDVPYHYLFTLEDKWIRVNHSGEEIIE